jgi:hypothetical protein
MFGVAPPELKSGVEAVTAVTSLVPIALIWPWTLPKALKIVSVAAIAVFVPTEYPVSVVPVMPVTCEAGKLKAERVVSVEFEVAVMLAAVPVVFWFNVGTSEAAISLKIGAPAPVVGAAKKVCCAWLFKDAKVNVPVVVTGLPVIVNRPVLSANPTDVTPVFDTVIVWPALATLMPVPPTKAIAPVMPLTLDTVTEASATSCQDVPFHS